MSDDDDLYRVVYRDADGREQLTGAMPLDAARSRAHDLKDQGCAVGSVMGDVAARGYMRARYAPTYRGVDIPLDLRADGVPYRVFEEWKRGVDAELDGAKAPEPKSEENPFAPDLSMSREAADLILRAVTGLLWEGYWQKAYDAETRHGGIDVRDYDADLVRRAADVVGRDRIKNRDLLRYLAELDEEDGAS